MTESLAIVGCFAVVAVVAIISSVVWFYVSDLVETIRATERRASMMHDRLADTQAAVYEIRRLVRDAVAAAPKQEVQS